jgi:hypothetical protein
VSCSQVRVATATCAPSYRASRTTCWRSDSVELEEAGIVDRAELPPPVARTVYSLSDLGWHRVLPILQSVAWFGLDLLEPPDNGPVPQLNGFLAGVLLAFDPARASDLDTSYRVDIDGRRFEFAVQRGRLAAAQGPPAVTVTATATDLGTARLGSTAAECKGALRRLTFEGEDNAVAALRTAFQLSGDPAASLRA